MSRFLLSKSLLTFGLSLLVSIGWMQSLWLSLPRDEHIIYPTFTNYIFIISFLGSPILLLVSFILFIRQRKWLLSVLVFPIYVFLGYILALGIYAVNGNNYLPFYSSITGLSHLSNQQVENFTYNVAHYGSMASTWYALYQCDSLGIQCDLLFETSGEENRGNRFRLDNLSLEYDASSNKISVLYGTEIMYSHFVPSSK